jgi:hypothetical protein
MDRPAGPLAAWGVDAVCTPVPDETVTWLAVAGEAMATAAVIMKPPSQGYDKA